MACLGSHGAWINCRINNALVRFWGSGEAPQDRQRAGLRKRCGWALFRVGS